MIKSTHSLCHTTESRDTELKHTTMRMNTTCHLATDYTGKRRKKKKKKKKREWQIFQQYTNTPWNWFLKYLVKELLFSNSFRLEKNTLREESRAYCVSPTLTTELPELEA